MPPLSRQLQDRSRERTVSTHWKHSWSAPPWLPPSLPPSIPPSGCCLGSVRPQLPAECWGTARVSGTPEVRCSEWDEAGTTGRPAVGGSGQLLQSLPRATFKLAPALRRHLGSPAFPARREPASRRGGHRTVSVPGFAPLPLPVLDRWHSGVPQASLLWDEDLVQGSLGRTRRRLERGKVVKGSHFLSPPRKPKQQRLEVVSPSLKSGQLSTFPPLHSP